MNRNLLLVFVMLVTLFMVNASPHLLRRTTKFGPCDLPVPKTLIFVAISTDPLVPGQPVDVTVSGTLPDDVTDDMSVVIEFHDEKGNQLGNNYLQYACVDGCPKANTPFSIKAPQVPVPGALNPSYGMHVVIANADFDHILGCAYGNYVAGDIPPPKVNFPALTPHNPTS